jgi:hypothetical protein
LLSAAVSVAAFSKVAVPFVESLPDPLKG